MKSVGMMGWLLVLLGIAVVVLPASTCPSQCQCTQLTQGTTVECRRQDFFQVPEGFPQDTIELDLGENNIPVLASSTFPRLNKLRKLVMDSCSIRRLENYALSAFPQLQNLTLTENTITFIGQSAFHELPNLQYIYLKNNNLKAIPELLFDDLHLVDLYLDNNQITVLTGNTFQGSNIVNVNLNHNNFERLPSSALLPLKNSLKTFQLSHNKRGINIDSDAFQGFYLDSLLLRNSSLKSTLFLKYVNTKTLDISSNVFSDLDLSAFDTLNSVEVLYAQNLGIQFLDINMLSSFTGLKYLNLGKNQIVMFSAEIFSHMESLRTLVMEDNPFIMLPSNLGEHQPGLTELHLARCHVMTLSKEIFENMRNLTTLDIRHNKVQVIPESMKPLLERIGDVQLQGNPLHCNCEMLWFWQYQHTPSGIAANYTCYSPRRVAISDLTADQFKCSAPKVIDSKPDMTSLIGDDVYLTCVAEGDPAPEVEWEAPTGEVLRITPSYNRTMYKTYAIWRLKRVDLHRSGVYTCRATNMVATVTAETQLQVVTSLPVTPNMTMVVKTTSSTTSSFTSSSTTTTTETTTASFSSSLTLPSYNITPYSNFTLMNFTVLMNSSAVVITVGPANVVLNVTSAPSIDNEDAHMTNKTNDKSFLIKIIIIICCTVGFVLFIVCVIFIARQRRLSQKYNVSSNSFDDANREHLTSKPQPTPPPVENGEEKQKLTQV